MTKTKLSVEKIATMDVDGKLEKRIALAKFLEDKLNALNKDLETRKYLVEGGKDVLNIIYAFIESNAKWNFSECMGIIETCKQLDMISTDITKGRTKEIMLSSLPLEAIYYFISKETGTGLGSALHYYNNILKPVTDALNRAKIDKDKRDQLVKDLATVQSALDSGAASELEDNMMAEMEKEYTI